MFFENNAQRVRSEILNMLYDTDDNDSDWSKHAINGDTDNDTDDSDWSESNTVDSKNNDDWSTKTCGKSVIDKIEDTIQLPPIDDDEEDEEKQLNLIRENERKLKLLKSNYFSCESIPVDMEDSDEFVNRLIEQNLDTIDNGGVYINYGDKSYKVSINSAEADESFNTSVEKTVESVSLCTTVYKSFEAFYENYIFTHPEFKQLAIFNKIISNNLIQHPFLIDIINNFREYIVDMWTQKFIDAQEMYNFSFSNPRKWVKKAELVIFNLKLKKPIIEYTQFIGSLLVLFDVHLTYKLNKHLYKNIEMENVKPIDFKKDMYTANELVVYHSYGKNISKVLLQDLVDNIHINQNITILNLDLNLYNRIFADSIMPLEECFSSKLGEKVDQYILKDNNFPDILKQPIIYIDPDTHKVYIFDYHKLCGNFDEKNYINSFTNKPFQPEFIEQCLEKMKNINLCSYCKDNCVDESKTLKTIYHDSHFGPIVLKFCSVDCFSDIEWKPKTILNTII